MRRTITGGKRQGFTLVALVVITTVMTILVAAAMPMWSQIVKRDREAELIFRGLQYAEAIRVFQQRFQRYPVSLEELLNVEPRCVRQLWTDPMTDGGEWGYVRPQEGRRGRGGRRGQQARLDRLRRGGQPDRSQEEETRGGLTVGGEPQELGAGTAPSGRASSLRGRQAMGPIQGVYSRSSEIGVRTFMDSQQYNEWRFTPDLLPIPAVVPGSLNILRANSDRVGRAFPPGLEPKQGNVPGRGQPPRRGQGQNQQRRRSTPDG